MKMYETASQARARFSAQLAVSVVFHLCAGFVLTHVDLGRPSRRPIYDEFVRPLQRNVLYYRPPQTKAEAAPETRIGDSPESRARVVAPRTAVTQDRVAPSREQLISQPLTLPELAVDVPVPSVVARVEAPQLPGPPRRPEARTFVAPARSPQSPSAARTEVGNVDLPTANLTAPDAPGAVAGRLNAPRPAAKSFVAPAREASRPAASQTEVGSLELPSASVTAPGAIPVAGGPGALPKAPARAFVAPTRNPAQPGSVARTEVGNVDLAAANLATPAGTPVPAPGNISGAPKAPARTFSAPASKGTQPSATRAAEVGDVNLPTAALAAPAAAGGPTRLDVPAPPAPGNASANVVIVSVNPANNVEAVPAGNRAGAFDRAPELGAPSSGTPDPNALTAPGVAVRDARPAMPELPQTIIVYEEKVRSTARATFSAPLRPASRSIPRALEARFAGRAVYATVIPIENLPAYEGDWILWFAERMPPAGAATLVRAPAPARKREATVPRNSAVTRVQMAAVIGLDGKLRDAVVLPPTGSAPALSAEVQAKALEDLTSWEFQPATRNGAAVEIDAVFEIAVHLPLP